MGTVLHARGIQFNSCFDELNIDDPARVAEVHRAYIDAGAQIILTNTFGANRYKLTRHGLETRLVEINRAAVELARRGRSISGARVLILGIAYKKNVEDTRESPALYALNRLEQMGAVCDYHDPYFPVMPVTRDHPSLAGRRSVALGADAVAAFDAVLVTTDHTDVDYPLVARSAQLILDTRNVFDGQGIPVSDGRLVKI